MVDEIITFHSYGPTNSSLIGLIYHDFTSVVAAFDGLGMGGSHHTVWEDETPAGRLSVNASFRKPAVPRETVQVALPSAGNAVCLDRLADRIGSLIYALRTLRLDSNQRLTLTLDVQPWRTARDFFESWLHVQMRDSPGCDLTYQVLVFLDRLFMAGLKLHGQDHTDVFTDPEDFLKRMLRHDGQLGYTIWDYILHVLIYIYIVCIFLTWFCCL